MDDTKIKLRTVAIYECELDIDLPEITMKLEQIDESTCRITLIEDDSVQ